MRCLISTILSSAAAACWLLSGPCSGAERASKSETPASFVRAKGTGFVLDGAAFYVTGVNNHYLTFASPDEVTRVLDDAVAMHANVVRTFIQPVIGSLHGTSVPTIWDWRARADSSNLGANGNYMAFWDDARSAMGINDGPNGLQRLDFVIAEAKRRNIKLIVAFLDFWAYTGGAQQMRAWYGGQDKHTFFFIDSRTRRDYRNLVRHVLLRVNPLTGTPYKDEPTIFAWELMNEPYGRPDWLLQDWIEEMATFVKSIDANHLVTSGGANVDSRISDLAISAIDFGTWHGYPLYYKLTTVQFDHLIQDFCAIAQLHDKPVLLEEFGYARSNPDQADAYTQWLSTLRRDPDCAGWLVWRLVSRQDHGAYPKDEHDQFDIHNDGGKTWTALKEAASNGKATTTPTLVQSTKPASDARK